MKEKIGFVHLHNHSCYSLLDGLSRIDEIIEKAKEYEMDAVALTDHGNLFGAFEFYEQSKNSGIKPIIGSEVYLVQDRTRKKFTREEQDLRWHLLLLAKNKKGYQNLSNIVSIGYQEGLYGGFPRIDKEILEKYSDGLIVTSGCLASEIPYLIARKKEAEAYKVLKYYLDVFGERFYIELQNQNIMDVDGTGISQIYICSILHKWAQKNNIKCIITNDSHYISKSDEPTHDIMLCINTNSKVSDPKGHGPGKRFGFYNDEFYFKSPREMFLAFVGLFDEKEIIKFMENTLEIAHQIEDYSLHGDFVLPEIPVPKGFNSIDEYFEHLVWEGAKKVYKNISDEIKDRIRYEISVIKEMGFASYFLIVRDIINWAKDNGIYVGPGRGSAAGSIVSYCLGITQIDPIKYGLLFERFLNLGRKSLPDIDTDFEDTERDKVLEYITNKYGKDCVGQIITFQRLQDKASFKDVARVLDIPFSISNKISKIYLNGNFTYEQIKNFIKKDTTIPQNLSQQILNALTISKKLDNIPRSIGKHAAGIVIAPGKLTNYLPVCIVKDSPLPVTQYEMEWVEKAGLVKIDILGLTTLSVIKNTLKLIKELDGIEININEIPQDDPLTFELFQRGELIGIFQFESEGMRKYMKKLKPTSIEDLMAMNALYRPGPMKFIDEYIECKNNPQKIKKVHPILDECLKETYGILVYQEQVIRIAKEMAGYSPSEADDLRKVISKKQKEKIPYHKEKFIQGCLKNSIPKEIAEQTFARIEEFGDYGFNKSHAAAYSILAYQTAYLKAHYPAYYMAALLSAHMNNRTKLNEYMQEARRMNLNILPPDLNKSRAYFYPQNEKEIRMGLLGIKDIGEALVSKIIEERDKNNKFLSLIDFIRRMKTRALTKKSLEALGFAGALDSFLPKRNIISGTYPPKNESFAEKLINTANTQNSNTLFSNLVTTNNNEEIPIPLPPQTLSDFQMLLKEREYIGFFLTKHPLDFFQPIPKLWDTITVSKILSSFTEENNKKKNHNFSSYERLTLIVTDSISTKEFLQITCEDYTGTLNLKIHSSSTEVPLQVGDIILLQATFSGKKMSNLQILPINRINHPIHLNIWMLFEENPLKILASISNFSNNEFQMQVIINLHIKNTRTATTKTFKSATPINLPLHAINELYNAHQKNILNLELHFPYFSSSTPQILAEISD